MVEDKKEKAVDEKLEVIEIPTQTEPGFKSGETVLHLYQVIAEMRNDIKDMKKALL